MTPSPSQEVALERWLRKRYELAIQPPRTHRKNQNPKWNDDEWFEKKFGDPAYYNRVNGLE
jgi:hypothetical protein